MKETTVGMFMVFVLLMILPAGMIFVLGQQRGCRHAWLYALAAYVLGPLALMLFLWRTSFKHCSVCHAECSWDAVTCRTCLAPFPMTLIEDVRIDDVPGDGQKEDFMSQGVIDADPAAAPAVVAPQRVHERPPVLRLPVGDLVEMVQTPASQQPLQVTINITQPVPTSGPTVAVWRACQRIARSPWMPWHPFALVYRSYREGYAEAASHPGLLRTIVWIAIGTGVAAVLWRHWMAPISVAGGLLAFLVIIARTGQLREIIAALQAAGGLPAILTVLQYGWIILARKVGQR